MAEVLPRFREKDSHVCCLRLRSMDGLGGERQRNSMAKMDKVLLYRRVVDSTYDTVQFRALSKSKTRS